MMTTAMAAKSPAGGGGDGRWLCWLVARGDRPVNLGSLFSVFGFGEEENGRLEEKREKRGVIHWYREEREKWLANLLKQDPSFFKTR